MTSPIAAERRPGRLPVVASIVASIIVSLGAAFFTLAAWAFDPCGGGGVASRCGDPGSGDSNWMFLLTPAVLVVTWSATAWVISMRSRGHRQLLPQLAIGVGGPVLAGTAAAAMMALIA